MSSLCKVMAKSHVAAVAVAVLLLWSMDLAFRALWEPLSRIAEFLFTAIAILDIPYISHGMADRAMSFTAYIYLQ